MKTDLCETLGIDVPIFAFSHCRDVVAAVSRAGGLGVLGAVAFSAEQLELELTWIDAHVDGKPYGVDTVMPANYVGRGEGDITKEKLDAMIPKETKAFVENLLQRHDVPPIPEGVDHVESLLGWSLSQGRAHVEVAMRHPIKLLANALGAPPKDVIEAAHEKNILVAALIGTVPQALKQKEAGVDIIIASGNEAGGHTGAINTMVLVPQVVDAVSPTPVLAAGGVGSGRQMAASMALGAQGVWTGSIWLTVSESDCVPGLVEKLLKATSADTVRSRCLSGKPARMLKTDYTEAWEAEDSPGYLPMPLQFMSTADATQRIHRFSQTDHPRGAELLGTPVGQVVGMMNTVKSASQVVYDMVNEYVDAVERLSADLHKR